MSRTDLQAKDFWLTHHRIPIISGFIIFGLILGLLLAIGRFYAGQPEAAWGTLGLVLIFSIAGLLVKKGHITAAAHIVVSSTILLGIAGLLVTSGSMPVPQFTSFPVILIALFTLGIRWGLFWTVFILIRELILYYVGKEFLGSWDVGLTPAQVEVNRVFGILSMLIMTFLLGAYYRRITEKSQILYTQIAEMKELFLANISHEIRTPLNGVIGIAHILKDQPEHPERSQLLDALDSSAQGLLRTINDMLDFSKLQSGKLSLDPAPTDLSQVMIRIYHLFNSIAESKGLAFNINSSPSKHWVQIDAFRLGQILNNLISNAIKFTQKGSISVTAQVKEITAKDGELVIQVSDTGHGMNEEEIQRLFRPFEQASASIGRRFGGTGLGLSICKQLVDLMGGTIEVRSEVDRGTSFHLCFPVVLLSAPASHQTSEMSAKPTIALDVLVVEDNPINRKVIQHALETLNCRVSMAHSGEAALVSLSRSSFDLILMDLRMPGWDGIRTTQEIRKTISPEITWIVALSASIVEEDKKACEAVGMQGYLSKPVNKVELQQLLAARAKSKVPPIAS